MKFKKLISVILTVLLLTGICVIPTPISAADTSLLSSNGNGYSTDIGIWYVPYNNAQLFNNGWATDSNGNRISIGSRQLIGYDENGNEIFGIPDTADPDMLDFDIEQIANAGIDFIVIDLTNGGLADLRSVDSEGNTITEHCFEKVGFHAENTKRLCQRIAEWNKKNEWKIRYSIAVGTYESIRGVEWENGVASTYNCTVAEAGEWQAEAVYKHFYTDDEIGGDNYYHLDGKPLILLHDWGQNSLTCKAYSYNPSNVGWNYYDGKNYGNHFTVRASQSGEAGTYGWHTYSTAATGNSEVEVLCPSHRVYGALVERAGIDEWNISRSNGNYYKKSWDNVLARQTLPRIIMLSAYNDYCEEHALAISETSGVNTTYDEVWYDPDGNYTTDYYWNLTKENIKTVRNRSTKQEVKNLALSATVELNGSEYLENNGYGKAQLNDGITDDDASDGLKWASALYGDDNYCYFELDFATSQTVNNVVFYQPKGPNAEYNKRPQELAVDLKLSDGSWVRVGEKHNLSIADKEDTYTHNFIFRPYTNVIAVRLTGSKARSTQTNILNMHACELEVYYNPTYRYKDYTKLDTEDNSLYLIPMPDTTETVKDYNFAPESSVTISKQNAGMGSQTHVNDEITYNNNNYAVVVMSSALGYVNFTLDEKKTVNYVKLYNSAQQSASRPMEYAVDVKTTDGSWMRVAEKHNVSIGNKIIEFKFAPVQNVTDVKVSVSQARNNGTSFKAWCIEEIEIYYSSTVTVEDYTGIDAVDDVAYAIPIESINVAPLGKAYNSNINESTYGTYHASLVNNSVLSPNDASDNTVLSYLKTNNAYIGVKLDKEYIVNKVVYYGSNHETSRRIMDVAVDVKLKNGKWIRVAELHNINQPRDITFCFAPIKCVDVRIVTNRQRLIDLGLEHSNWRVCEIEVYYDSTVTPSQYSGVAMPDDMAYFLRMWDNTTNDINNDYSLDANDLVALKKGLLGVGNKNDECDVNADSYTNILDYIQFIKQIQY